MSLTIRNPEGLRKVNLKGCRAEDGRPQCWHDVVHDTRAARLAEAARSSSACWLLTRYLVVKEPGLPARVVRKRASHYSTDARRGQSTTHLSFEGQIQADELTLGNSVPRSANSFLVAERWSIW